MHRWVGFGVIADNRINVAQHANQCRMRGAAGHYLHRKVVR